MNGGVNLKNVLFLSGMIFRSTLILSGIAGLKFWQSIINVCTIKTLWLCESFSRNTKILTHPFCVLNHWISHSSQFLPSSARAPQLIRTITTFYLKSMNAEKTWVCTARLCAATKLWAAFARRILLSALQSTWRSRSSVRDIKAEERLQQEAEDIVQIRLEVSTAETALRRPRFCWERTSMLLRLVRRVPAVANGWCLPGGALHRQENEDWRRCKVGDYGELGAVLVITRWTQRTGEKSWRQYRRI